MNGKHLEGKGIFDYDYKHDIIFFKIREREYAKSIELDNIVIDIDKDSFIVGVQIFEASKFLHVSKSNLMNIPKWRFNAKVEGGKIEVRLDFQMIIRNKIVEKNPIVIQPTYDHLPDSEMICEVPY